MKNNYYYILKHRRSITKKIKLCKRHYVKLWTRALINKLKLKKNLRNGSICNIW
jgi:hypothetical protein